MFERHKAYSRIGVLADVVTPLGALTEVYSGRPDPAKLYSFFGKPPALPSLYQEQEEKEPGVAVAPQSPEPVLNEYGKYRYLRVVLECKDLWFHIHSFLGNWSKSRSSIVSRDWKEAAVGMELNQYITGYKRIKNLESNSIFICRKVTCSAGMDLFYCPSSVTSIDLQLGVDVDLSLFRNIKCLKELFVTTHVNGISQLPSSLTTLSIRGSTAVPMRIIPQGVTDLCLGPVYEKDPFFPQLLQRLAFRWTHLSDLPMFPSTLVFLQINIQYWSLCKKGVFPKSLETLRITCNDHPSMMGPGTYEGMDRLKELSLYGSQGSLRGALYPTRTMALFNAYQSTAIPCKGVKIFHQNCVELPKWSKGELPESLIELHCENMYPKTKNADFGVIPSNVLVLFTNGVPRDPVSRNPIPWTCSDFTGLCTKFAPAPYE